MRTKTAKVTTVMLYTLALLAVLLFIQQLTFVFLAEVYVDRSPSRGRVVIVSRSASWPWSAASAGMLLLLVVLSRSVALEANWWKMNRRQWAGVGLCAWAVVYLLMFVRYDAETGRIKPDQLRLPEDWETSDFLRQVAYDPTFSLGLLLGAGQLAAGIVLAAVGGGPWYVRGHCRKCGYYLLGNTSGVCPECGTSVKPNVEPNVDPNVA